MITSHDPVVARVFEAIEQKHAITFGNEIKDNEYPEITWQCYGLTESNEIALIARCGELQLGICRESNLAYPQMADRIFGMDITDQQLAFALVEELWSQNSERLSTEVLRVRNSGRTSP